LSAIACFDLSYELLQIRSQQSAKLSGVICGLILWVIMQDSVQKQLALGLIPVGSVQ